MAGSPSPIHSMETCVHTNILAHNLVKTLILIVFKNLLAKMCMHNGKYLVNMHKKKCRSRTIFRNRSALGNMTTIQT